MIAVTFDEEWGGSIAILITAFGIGIVWSIFLSCHLIEFAFVKSVDDLFIAYDGKGDPYSVEVSQKRVRILYRNLLYVIKGNKIKTIRSERKIYYAYLNMFPQSVLSMEKYVDNSDASSKPLIIPSVNYFGDGRYVLSLGELAYLQSQELPASSGSYDLAFTRRSLLRHLHFYRYIFTINNKFELVSVYSAARENSIINYSVLTCAEISERGNAATEALKEIANANKLLKSVLNNIDKSN